MLLLLRRGGLAAAAAAPIGYMLLHWGQMNFAVRRTERGDFAERDSETDVRNSSCGAATLAHNTFALPLTAAVKALMKPHPFVQLLTLLFSSAKLTRTTTAAHWAQTSVVLCNAREVASQCLHRDSMNRSQHVTFWPRASISRN